MQIETLSPEQEAMLFDPTGKPLVCITCKREESETVTFHNHAERIGRVASTLTECDQCGSKYLDSIIDD